MNYILYNIIINSILVGIILMTQFVNYPLFKTIDLDFNKYHQKYTERMGFVVAPLMIIELILVMYITINHYNNLLVILISLLTFFIWTSTFFIQVPVHNNISRKRVDSQIAFLIKSNYIRTVCWLIKLIISIELLYITQ